MERALVTLAKFWHKIMKRLARITGRMKTVYVQDRVPYYRELWQDAAKTLGMEFASLSESVWELRQGRERVCRIDNYIAQIDDPVTLNVAGDKVLTYALLADAGLTLPRFAEFSIDSLDKLEEFRIGCDGPFVVKPVRNTSSGMGVSTNLHGRYECLSAAALAFSYGEDAMIEEHLAGESYRLLFLGGQMICASRRNGIRITGDGAKTVAQLVDSLVRDRETSPADRERLAGPDAQLVLASQGLRTNSVIPEDASVLVASRTASESGDQEVRTIYTDDVTALICDELVEEGSKAAAIVGSEFCGVDVITTDPTVPLRMSKGAINEINTTPGLHHHYFLKGPGPEEPLAVTVLRYIAAKRRFG